MANASNVVIPPGAITHIYTPTTSSTLTWGSSATSVTLPHPLNSEEEKELENLQKDMNAWKKAKKIASFKTLHQELRQEIVDEACYIEFIKNMENVNELEFQDYQKIQALKVRQSPYFIGGISSGCVQGGAHYIGNTWKFQQIHQTFTKDELMMAHSEASLEEELRNSNP